MKVRREILQPNGFWKQITDEENEAIKQNTISKDFDIKFYQSNDDFRNNEVTVIITEILETKP